MAHKPRLMTHDSQPPAHKPKVTTPGYRPTDIKGKNKGKEQNKEIEQDYILKWRGSSSVCLFFVSIRRSGRVYVVCAAIFLLF